MTNNPKSTPGNTWVYSGMTIALDKEQLARFGNEVHYAGFPCGHALGGISTEATEHVTCVSCMLYLHVCRAQQEALEGIAAYIRDNQDAPNRRLDFQDVLDEIEARVAALYRPVVPGPSGKKA